jgi:diguanylate cyclase (GGDEF)-like protein
MPAETNAVTTQTFATRAVLWLELVALAVGALQFAFATTTVSHPLIAAAGLALLSMSILLVRTIPALQRSHTRQHWLAIVSLLICISLLVIATGGIGSALVTLYLIPLAVVALAFGNWLLVALVSAAIVGLGYALGALTPGVDVRSGEFAVLLMSALAPGVAVAVALGALIGQMQSAVQRIRDLAATDSLTGLLNLRAFEEVLQQEHRKAERFGRPYTVIVVDTDNLKLVNETLGHEAGSQVIVAVAAAISRSIRGSDIAARLGGDEFIVLLIEADAATGAGIAQRIRNNVYAGTVSVANRLIRANASIGIATFPEDHLYPKELMILADQRMQEDRELRRPAPSE